MSDKLAMVMGAYHRADVEVMAATSRESAAEFGIEIVEEVWVPGALEKPLALRRVLMADHIAGAVALGIIQKGETNHDLVIGQAVTAAIIQLQLEFMKPIGVGILGPGISSAQIPPRRELYARAAVEAVHSMLQSAR